MSIKKLLLIFTFVLSIISSTSWAMEDDVSGTEEKQICKTKKKSTEKCEDNCESETSNGTTVMRGDGQDERAKNRIWYDGGCCKGGCTTQPNTYATGQREDDTDIEIEIDRYQLFTSSFLSGAAYSLVPEIVRDGLESRGYPRASNIVATIILGGMIVYNSPSYIAPVTGMVVRISCDQLGFSPKTSAIAGSTAAIAASLSQKLIYSHETVLDSVVDVAIGVAGSYTGSALALKAKTWVYSLWGSNNPIMVCEKDCQPYSGKTT